MNATTIYSLGTRFVVPILGCIFAAGTAIWLMEAANPLGAFCVVATLIMILMAIVAPRAGLLLLLVLCAYSDMLKRMLVLFGSLSYEQVSNVLMAAPAVVLALIVSVFTKRAFHRIKFRGLDLLIIAGALVLSTACFLFAMRSNGTLFEAAKDAVNQGLYPAIALVGLRLFTNSEETEKFLRNALIIFCPVAVYGLLQLFFGFADFEIDYLRSGLTIEAKQLYDVRPRPFSTLNSAGVYGTLCAGFAVLALYPRLASRFRSFLPREKFGSVLIALLFFAGAIGSLVRASHIVWITALVCLGCFRSKTGTLLFYATGIGCFLGLIFSAQFLLDHIEDLDPARFGETDYTASLLTIQTYSDRLKGFINLTSNPRLFTLFGLDTNTLLSEEASSHDPVSTILFRHGIIGLGVAIVLGTAVLSFIHRRLLTMPKGRERTLALLLISVLMGWLVAEILLKAVITTFPLNALFWLLLGALGRIVTSGKTTATIPVEPFALPAPSAAVISKSRLVLMGRNGQRIRQVGEGLQK